jgi:PIN domain nuclease of toxin-antitoxin system
MKYLLDTHTLLWVYEDSPKLSEKVRQIIADNSSLKYISVASFWEIAIKLGAGKLKIDGGLLAIESLSDESGLMVLPVKREYIRPLPDMPFHHKDPFDRLLIATAIVENMTLITTDENIHKYDLTALW